jgi:conserved hypothetical protein TIGR02688
MNLKNKVAHYLSEGGSKMVEEKVKQVFSDMVVLKEPKRSEFFSNLSLPSYMRDWLVMKFSDNQGNIDYDGTLSYIKKFIPDRDAYQVIKYRLMQGSTEKLLARVRLEVNLKKGVVQFELPDFGGARGGASGIVSDGVLEQYADVLLKESENWGIIELALGSTLSLDDDFNNGSHAPKKFYDKLFGKSSKHNEEEDDKPSYKPNEIYLSGYKPFCPYRVDLNFYKAARKNFDIHEWIDVIISAVDYNPAGYVDSETGEISEETKLFFLRRLLPFVEKRINLIELAPKGTGKSYIYEKISKRGWLISGGTVSRATLIYDNAKKVGGLLTRFDYVGFDEVQSITFEQPGQIQQALKHYMEFGEIKGFDAQMATDAGVIVLGNIDAGKFDINQNMVENISEVFGESATLDRFHGFIPGWKIPRLNQDLIANGWAINTEYFAEVLHAMRDELSYAALVDACLDVPPKADKRDMTAIKRLCTAFVKLLYPNAQRKEDIAPDEFIKYCLNPAKEMRAIIKRQLCIVDPKEFDVPGKSTIPDVQYKE